MQNLLWAKVLTDITKSPTGQVPGKQRSRRLEFRRESWRVKWTRTPCYTPAARRKMWFVNRSQNATSQDFATGTIVRAQPILEPSLSVRVIGHLDSAFYLYHGLGQQRPLTRGLIIPKIRVNVDGPWAKRHENNASAALVGYLVSAPKTGGLMW
jgi:hypothetical protein